MQIQAIGSVNVIIVHISIWNTFICPVACNAVVIGPTIESTTAIIRHNRRNITVAGVILLSQSFKTCSQAIHSGIVTINRRKRENLQPR